ncbi:MULTISPECIES: amidohydrolase [unclassified Sphingopyxis]|uniref:amidohydrolase n=1 Tax=unclassified Sphingopyxis TaxID=2614943 RepID=UPI0028544A37|nr:MULTISPECIES: amidohydrolase [unclassified Sphingopyxis]MDR7059666.1 hippurate hydrolase [Sphingopyxis sp. BE235]MDR7180822.1 hippurate hydrolase [Sphingopyxis sp. BE249]
MRILWTSAAALALAAPAAAQTLGGEVEKQMPSLMAIYKDLHANPELSFMEVRSAGILAAEARKLGFKVTEKVGGTGIVAVMENGPGPVVLVRADMDGLPVTEQTGLPGASKIRVTTKEGVETGVMHACGHDTHMTAWVGVARLMAANKAKWSGTLVMIGQPAEERGAGARMMLADGLYTRFPKPEYVLAFHDAAQFPAGKIGYTPGYALANVDSVDITVKGVGGHGAYPQTTKDPIVLASRIVGALQTLVSREISPLDSAVVTVGSFHAGAKHNIISDEAKLQLTVRSYSDEVRDHLLDGIARIAKGEAIAAGMPDDKMPVVSVDKNEYTPSTFNTPEFTEEMAAYLKTSFGADRVVQMPPVMGGEDFSRFGREDKSIKSLIVWVGGVPQAEYDAAKKEGRTLPSLHSPFWAPDAPAVISTATEALTAMTMKLMAKG